MTVSWVGDVYVGAETGLVKSVQLHNQNWINLGGKPSKARRENEILRMCWADGDETQLLMGLRSGDVFRVDVPTQSCVNLWSGSDRHFGADGKLVGLETYDGNVVAAIQKGSWAVFRRNNDGIWAPSTVTSMSLKKHQDCRRLRINPTSSHGVIVATGGLNEHLKLWDVNSSADTSLTMEDGEEKSSPTPFFAAKNVKNDWLNLQVRTCIQDIRFIPGSDQVVTCTGYHQVKLYDPKSQRRPVVDFESGEFPLTCMDVVPSNTNQIIVGNTRGVMSQHDLRMKGRMVHGFKGFAGGLRDIRCHPTEPLVASVGLDRYMRVHNHVNHRIVNKIYLKSRLNQCLFKTVLNEGVQLEGDEEEAKEDGAAGLKGTDEDVGDADDELWETMETVGAGKKVTETGETQTTESGGRTKHLPKAKTVDKKRKRNPDEEEDDDDEEEEETPKATVTIVDEGKRKKQKRIKS